MDKNNEKINNSNVDLTNVKIDLNNTINDNKTAKNCDSNNTHASKWSKLKNLVNYIVFYIDWPVTLYHILLLVSFLYGSGISFYYVFTKFNTERWYKTICTWTWTFFLATCGGIGLSAGAHRLWSHHAYKAKPLMKFLLVIMYTQAGETSIFNYVRYHRSHHKYLDTNADPQNVKRGFFYAQIGWRLIKFHPDYINKQSTISFDDLYNDKFAMFHHRYYLPLVLIVGIFLPSMVGIIGWNEDIIDAFAIIGLSKCFLVIHLHGLVGSVCHSWGKRRYNKRISASDNGFIQFLVAGEGYHNFHHVFPYDYALTEFAVINFPKLFIDISAKLGLASDLRKAGPEYVAKAKEKASQYNKDCYEYI